jgi:hypothetical protein
MLNFLQAGQPSIGLFTSEGGQFLGGHGMSNDARLRMMTGLSGFWDSGSAQRIRAKEISRISGRRLSISLAAQPSVAAMLLGDELAHDQGFLGRFLITYPESNIGNRIVREARVWDDLRLRAFHERVTALLNARLPLREDSNNELDPPSIPLDKDAWELWREFAQVLEDDCGPEGRWRPVKAAALKMAENVARIAASLTLFDNPKASTIDEETMAAACRIGSFYLKEALRLVGHEALDPETKAVDELAQWLTQKWPHPLISSTQIQQKAPRHLRVRADKTQKWIKALLAAGVLEYVGKAEIDGKSYREVYKILQPDAETGAA